MRKAFVKTLIELAEKDDKIFLLTADLGSDFDEFVKKFPRRFINCGIAEQNMMGVAAGLALCGRKPYVYSIIPFVTMRAFEQIKNDICYQNLDVKIIGMGAGFHYGPLGCTHHAIEDFALRVLPNIMIISPADGTETRELVLQAYKKGTPTYIRMSKSSIAEEDMPHKNSLNIELGEPAVLKSGKDGVIISTGAQVKVCLGVAKKLSEHGKDLKVIGLHTLKPIDKNALLDETNNFKNIIIVEEHNILGGLAAAVCEILVESDNIGRVKKIGIPDEYSSDTGSCAYLQKKYLLDKDNLASAILKFLEHE